MSPWVIQLVAGAVLLVFLWRSFRLAMSLRASRVRREEEREAEEARGRRIVAEVPVAKGELHLFVDDGSAFEWLGARLPKAQIVGGRLLLNRGVMASCVRPGARLPEAGPAEEFEGRERWDVRVFTEDGSLDIPCGTYREGVSREIARSVFAAVQAALPADTT